MDNYGKDALATELSDTLEDVLDRTNPSIVVEMLADICHEKAAHILEMWQDPNLAQDWEKAGTYLNRVANAKAIAQIV
jgi:hypothetical protein